MYTIVEMWAPGGLHSARSGCFELPSLGETHGIDSYRAKARRGLIKLTR